MKTTLILAFILHSAFCILPCLAEVPEPDYVLYGQIIFGAAPVTRADHSVVVEARRIPGGPVIASYGMGSQTNYGDFYSLRLPLEAFLPVARSESSQVGALVYLAVRDTSGVRIEKTTSIASRGKLVRLDFVELDTDGDGLPDRWEQQHFASATAGDPNADPDHDGRSNLQEFLDGTNPLVADGRHPADLAPSDNLLTFEEADAYALAWLMGDTWAKGPTNIPISYVTRAAKLYAGGGQYAFTNVPPTNAPMWWVNWPPAGSPAATNASHVASAMTNAVAETEPFVVTLSVTPAGTVKAQAVEDAIPVGWTVWDVSHGGNYDEVNGKIKWGPFYDAGERELYYQLSPPPGLTGAFTFAGLGSFDGFDVLISGARALQVGTSPSNLVPRFVLCAVDEQGPSFTVTGAPGQEYQVEVSTNLTTWTPLGPITTDGTGQHTLRPADAGLSPYRFYRLRRP